MSIDTPVLDAVGLARFDALCPGAADVVATTLAAGAACEPASAWGLGGREACRDDVGSHLAALRTVLEFGFVDPMVDRLRWLADVLVTRDQPTAQVGMALDGLAAFFAAALAAPYGAAVVAALERTKAAFLAPEVEPQHVREASGLAWGACEEFEGALLAGDRRGAGALFDRCLDEGSGLIETEVHLIQPSLYQIGRKWQANQVSVAQEHMATAISQALMAQRLVRCVASAAVGHRILLACVEGNTHSVGLQMVADSYHLAGWEVQYLGASVPTDSLLQQLARFEPHLLGLSIASPRDFGRVGHIMANLLSLRVPRRPRMVVGGQAANQYPELVARLGVDGWSPDALAAVASGSRLVAPAGAA